MDSSDKKFYRVNISVSEEINWENKDLWYASYHCPRGKCSAITLAKQIFEILCSAYQDGFNDVKEFSPETWDANDEDW